MFARRSVGILGRLGRSMSSSSSSPATDKLPFEKPLFVSSILQASQRRQDSYANVEFYGDLLVIAVATSIVARVGYYCVYGKPGGARALPPRS